MTTDFFWSMNFFFLFFFFIRPFLAERVHLEAAVDFWMLSTISWLERLDETSGIFDGDDTIWEALCGRERDFWEVMGCLPSPSLSLTTQFWQRISLIFGRVPRISTIVLAGCEQIVLEWLSGKRCWINEDLPLDSTCCILMAIVGRFLGGTLSWLEAPWWSALPTFFAFLVRVFTRSAQRI